MILFLLHFSAVGYMTKCYVNFLSILIYECLFQAMILRLYNMLLSLLCIKVVVGYEQAEGSHRLLIFTRIFSCMVFINNYLY